MQYTDNYVLYFDYKNSTTKNNLVIVTIKIADIREEDIIVACMFWRENFRHVKIGHTLSHKKYAGISKTLVLTADKPMENLLPPDCNRVNLSAKIWWGPVPHVPIRSCGPAQVYSACHGNT